MAPTPRSPMPIPVRITLPNDGPSRFIAPLVFVAFGIGAVIWFRAEGLYLPGWRGYIPYAACGLFVATGVGSLIRELRRDTARDAAHQALEEHRDAPWRVRPEWRSPELAATLGPDRSSVTLALFWNLFAWPLAFLLIQGELESGNRAVWLVALFPLIGLGMLAKVGYELLRARKFGRVVVRLDPWPPRLGRRVEGSIQARMPPNARPTDGFRVRVSCYRQRVRHTRDSDGDRTKRVERDLLWRDETRLGDPPTAYGSMVEVPFAFQLPEDPPPSTPLKLENRIVWEVAAEADVPGIDFDSRVEVPVFPPEPGSGGGVAAPSTTAGTDDPAGAVGTVPDAATPGAAGPAVDPAPAWAFEEPLTEGILLVDEPDLFELHFTAARRQKGAIGMGILGAILFLAGFPALALSGLFGLILLVMGGFLLYGGIQQGTNDTVLRVADGRLQVTHDGIGMPADVDVPAGRVEEVLVHLESDSPSENAAYAISLVARAGEGLEHVQEQANRVMDVMSRFGVDEAHPVMDAMREGAERPRILVAGGLTDKDEADWLAYRVRQAVRRGGPGPEQVAT